MFCQENSFHLWNQPWHLINPDDLAALWVAGAGPEALAGV